MINNATAKISSDDASWLYQGMWQNATDLDYAIFPYTGPKGKGEWSNRHMGEDPAIYISKHIREVFQQIKKDASKISGVLRKRYF